MDYNNFISRVSDRRSAILWFIFTSLFILLTFDLVSGWLYVLCMIIQILIIVADIIWLYCYMPGSHDAPQINSIDRVVIGVEFVIILILLIVGFIDKNLFPGWINEAVWGWLIIGLAYFALTSPKHCSK